MWDINNCFTQASGTLAQTFTGDNASTNLIDLDSANIRISGMRPMFLIIKVVAAFDALTTLEIALETATDEAFNTAKKQVGIWNFALASLITANTLILCVPLGHAIWQRYIRLYYNVTGSDNTVGSLIGLIADGPEAAAAQLDLVGA